VRGELQIRADRERDQVALSIPLKRGTAPGGFALLAFGTGTADRASGVGAARCPMGRYSDGQDEPLGDSAAINLRASSSTIADWES
jgi:hypothetical protein